MTKLPKFKFLQLPSAFRFYDRNPQLSKTNDIEKIQYPFHIKRGSKYHYIDPNKIEDYLPKACWREGLYIVGEILTPQVSSFRERNALVYFKGEWYFWYEYGTSYNWSSYPYPAARFKSLAKAIGWRNLSKSCQNMLKFWDNYEDVRDSSRSVYRSFIKTKRKGLVNKVPIKPYRS